NINHDCSAAWLRRLLALVKPSLQELRLVDGPGHSLQEGYEMLSGLRSLRELHM
ncbi:hypothetical protein HaLaN_23838, partial [Haematococcus lacustris]